MLELPQDRKRKKDDTRASIILILIWALVAMLGVFIVALKANSDPLDAAEFDSELSIVNNYIDWFHRNVKPARARAAKKYAPLVVEKSLTRNLDPLKAACLISFESSWRLSAIGKAQEIGLMQVMPSAWAAKYDFTKPAGQIEAGTDRLRMAENKCSTEIGIFTHYASGHCRSKSKITQKKMKYRVRYYKARIDQFRR